MWKGFSYVEKVYFSFYLTTDSRIRFRDIDEKNQPLQEPTEDRSLYKLMNIEEKCHYEYIWNLLEWLLSEDGLNVNAASFISQYDMKRKQVELGKKYNSQRILVENAVDHLAPEVGQYIAIKQWNSALRLGVVESIKLAGRKQSFTLNLRELKKDLKPGKVNISLWSKSEIFAIIQPGQLSANLSKKSLLDMIEQGVNFTGLLWRRPQELW